MNKIFTKFFFSTVLLLSSATLFAQTYNGGVWYSLYDTGDASNVVVYTNFAEKSLFTPVESMTFDYKKYSLISINGKVEVQNKVDGSWQKKGDASYSDYKNYKTSSTIQLDANATNIRYYLASGNGVYVKNHYVKLAKHILLADGGFGKTNDSKSFETVAVGGQSVAQKVSLRSFLTTSDITITSDDSAFRINAVDNLEGVTYAVGANACASSNGQSGAKAGGGTLGDINQYAFDIYFCPSEAKTYNATITITDGTSTATITVSGEGVKKDQSVVWNEAYASGELTIGQVVEDAASATSGMAVTYSSSDESVVAIVNDGAAIKAVGLGVATVTATVAESVEWNASSAEMQFTVTGKLEQAIVWEQELDSINVLDTIVLTASAMTEVTYVLSDSTVASVDSNVLVLHTAGEVTVYAYAAESDVYMADTIAKTIVVSALEQAIVWEQELDSVNVLDTIVLTASAITEVTYVVSDSTVASVDSNVLVLHTAGEVTVYAYAAESDVYVADTIAKTIVVSALEQAIVWEQELDSVNLLDTIVLTASAMTEVTYVVSDSVMATVEGNLLVMHCAGEVQVYAYAAANGVYLADTVVKTVMANPLEQAIEWTMDTLVMVVGDTLMLNAVASSGLEVGYMLDVDGVVRVDNNMLIAQSVGEVVVTAVQEGSHIYMAAPEVAYTMTVVAQDVNTGCENMYIEESLKAYKVIRNGQILIVKGDRMYDLLGNLLN